MAEDVTSIGATSGSEASPHPFSPALNRSQQRQSSIREGRVGTREMKLENNPRLR